MARRPSWSAASERPCELPLRWPARAHRPERAPRRCQCAPLVPRVEGALGRCVDAARLAALLRPPVAAAPFGAKTLLAAAVDPGHRLIDRSVAEQISGGPRVPALA